MKRRTLRTADVRLFSSASDAPRARRPTDIVLFVLATSVAAALSFAAPGPGTIDSAVVNFFGALPGLIGWFWEVSYDLLFGWALLVLGVSLFARGRKRLLFCELLAAALAYLFAMAAGGIVGTEWPDGLRGLTSSDAPAVYPAMRLAVASAVVVAASRTCRARCDSSGGWWSPWGRPRASDLMQTCRRTGESRPGSTAMSRSR